MDIQDTTTPTTRSEERKRLDRVLQEAIATRREQLDLLPPSTDDPVATVQRAALRQTLTEIAAARRRIVEGSFGTCTACRQPIAHDRLESRPWSATCVRCAGR
jgi:RNA polymerase-binding transcription factor DksA